MIFTVINGDNMARTLLLQLDLSAAFDTIDTEALLIRVTYSCGIQLAFLAMLYRG